MKVADVQRQHKVAARENLFFHSREVERMVRWEVKTGAAVKHGNGEKIRELLQGAKSPLMAAYGVGYDHRRFRLHQPFDDLPESLLGSLQRKRRGIARQVGRGDLIAQLL